MSNEFICKLLPLVGLGTKEYIKAGHAALVLIENETQKARYFDFGRYVTPSGHGRVRGENTDAELRIPFSAKISSENTLLNLNEFLHWLDANPHKTHGKGRLLASVCDAIDFKKALQFITSLQQRGSIPYGAFVKEGSNCARFVTDTILAATEENKIIKALNFNKKFTPSTVGNVEKGATGNKVFEVYNGTITPFKGSAFKENLTNYFDKNNTVKTVIEAPFQPRDATIHKLEGTGSSAWFEVTSLTMPKHHFNIKRYNELGEVDYNGVYSSSTFDPSLPYQFTYDSHCACCHVLQNDKKIMLKGCGSLSKFNSLQKKRSA